MSSIPIPPTPIFLPQRHNNKHNDIPSLTNSIPLAIEIHPEAKIIIKKKMGRITQIREINHEELNVWKIFDY
jgi:hypothetical protein